MALAELFTAVRSYQKCLSALQFREEVLRGDERVVGIERVAKPGKRAAVKATNLKAPAADL
ncbi:MAG: hypothetical protein NVSMB26_07910 [Beijerinckiaceae bacterium]